MQKPRLRFRIGATEASYQLVDDRAVVGSSPEADLRLAGEGVGPRHMSLEWDGRFALMTALSEEFPVEVNGVARREWMLRNGDRLQLGDLTVTFHVDEADEPASAAVSTAPTPSVVSRPREPRARPAERAPQPTTLAQRYGRFTALVAIAAIGTLIVVAIRQRMNPEQAPSKLVDRLARSEDEFVAISIAALARPCLRSIDQNQPAQRAPLLIRRARAFVALESEDHPDTADIRELLTIVTKRTGDDPPWTYEELRFALEAAPREGRPEDYFRREQIEILEEFLRIETNEANRYYATLKLRDLKGEG